MRHSTLRTCVGTLLGCALASSCTFVRAAYWNVPTLDTSQRFAAREVPAAPGAQPLPVAPREITPPDPERFAAASASPHHGPRPAAQRFDAWLQANDTVALVVVHRGAIVYERYFDGFRPSALLPSFSLAKTVAALLVGAAFTDGLIGPLDRPLRQSLPELPADSPYAEITTEQLLRMTSGLEFVEESYDAAELYYTEDLDRDTLRRRAVARPGTRYNYSSLDVQLLGMVLRRALAGETLSSYFARRIWQPLGAEQHATWSLDSAQRGVEKFFGGFNATARDYARLGLLCMQGGTHGGRRILDAEWVAEALAPEPLVDAVTTSDGRVRRSRYQWFLPTSGPAFFAKGYLGQYLYVDPAHELVVVRFGRSHGQADWLAVFAAIAASL
jgi:CubicO group peptidase (beta-lactamase class C family)